MIGYAVECGLKACIAKLTNQYDYPNKELAQKCYTHRIEVLLEVSGLKPQRDFDVAANPVRGASWLIVKDWDETARYQPWTESQARKLIRAVTDATDGVLPWIMDRW